MSNKEIVIETIRQLPEHVTIEEIAQEIALLAGIRRGLDDIDAGRTTPHDEVKKRLHSWISK
jgi:predicted transcriptional regulator